MLPVRVAPRTRCHSEAALETSIQVTLIGETKVSGDRDDRDAQAQPPFGFGQSQMHLIRMQRQSIDLFKLSRQLKPTHRCHPRKVAELHVRAHVFTQVVVHSPERLLVQPRSASGALIVSNVESSTGLTE